MIYSFIIYHHRFFIHLWSRLSTQFWGEQAQFTHKLREANLLPPGHDIPARPVALQKISNMLYSFWGFGIWNTGGTEQSTNILKLVNWPGRM